MSELTKLYENAGIKGEWRDYRVKNGKTYDGKNPKNRNIRLCKPRFTAEKQLELIKWLGKLDGKLELQSTYNNEKFIFNFYFNRKTSKNPDPKYPYANLLSEDFSVLIAGLINSLWQDLTEEEKQQIKEILE